MSRLALFWFFFSHAVYLHALPSFDQKIVLFYEGQNWNFFQDHDDPKAFWWSPVSVSEVAPTDELFIMWNERAGFLSGSMQFDLLPMRKRQMIREQLIGDFAMDEGLEFRAISGDLGQVTLSFDSFSSPFIGTIYPRGRFGLGVFREVWPISMSDSERLESMNENQMASVLRLETVVVGVRRQVRVRQEFKGECLSSELRNVELFLDGLKVNRYLSLFQKVKSCLMASTVHGGFLDDIVQGEALWEELENRGYLSLSEDKATFELIGSLSGDVQWEVDLSERQRPEVVGTYQVKIPIVRSHLGF